MDRDPLPTGPRERSVLLAIAALALVVMGFVAGSISSERSRQWPVLSYQDVPRILRDVDGARYCTARGTRNDTNVSVRRMPPEASVEDCVRQTSN